MSRTWWYANATGKLAAPYQKHQLGVPRLPIPTLEESCARYLRAAQPLQSSADHAKTKQVVADFCKPGGEGELLQKELKRTDASLPAHHVGAVRRGACAEGSRTGRARCAMPPPLGMCIAGCTLCGLRVRT